MREFNEFQNESFEKEVMVEKQPEHETEERPRVERPRSVEEKIKFIISFIINFSTDKNQLLELRKILVELEFNEKEERKEMLENHERKIRRR